VKGDAPAHWGLLRQNKKKVLASNIVRVITPLRTKQTKRIARKKKRKPHTEFRLETEIREDSGVVEKKILRLIVE